MRSVLAGTVPFSQALSRSIDQKSRFFIQSASIATTTVYKRLSHQAKEVCKSILVRWQFGSEETTKAVAIKMLTFLLEKHANFGRNSSMCDRIDPKLHPNCRCAPKKKINTLIAAVLCVRALPRHP